jgi:hypothetical protein
MAKLELFLIAVWARASGNCHPATVAGTLEDVSARGSECLHCRFLLFSFNRFAHLCPPQ